MTIKVAIIGNSTIITLAQRLTPGADYELTTIDCYASSITPDESFNTYDIILLFLSVTSSQSASTWLQKVPDVRAYAIKALIVDTSQNREQRHIGTVSAITALYPVFTITGNCNDLNDGIAQIKSFLQEQTSTIHQERLQPIQLFLHEKVQVLEALIQEKRTKEPGFFSKTHEETQAEMLGLTALKNKLEELTNTTISYDPLGTFEQIISEIKSEHADGFVKHGKIYIPFIGELSLEISRRKPKAIVFCEEFIADAQARFLNPKTTYTTACYK